MSDSTTLADLGVGPNGTVQLEMQSADPVNNPIRSYRPRQEYQMPDVITVRVQTGWSHIFPFSLAKCWCVFACVCVCVYLHVCVCVCVWAGMLECSARRERKL